MNTDSFPLTAHQGQIQATRPVPPKVLVVSTSFPQSKSFIPGIFVEKLCDALQESGADVSVLSPSDAEHDAAYDSAAQVNVLRARYFFKPGELFFNRPPGGLPQRFKKFSWAWFLAPLAVTSLLWRTFWVARKMDIIHCHWFPTALFAWLPAKVWRKPLVITIHGSDAYFLAGSKWGRALMRIVFRQASRLVSVSEAFLVWLKENLPEFADKAEFLPNGVSVLKDSTQFRTASQTLRLVFIGNVVTDKGVNELRSTFKTLVEAGADIKLTIIGPCPDDQKSWLAEWIEDSPERIHFAGLLPQSEVLTQLITHDLLVLPTYREGRCSTIMEAMAARLPILTTNIPSMVEMLEHGPEAYLVEPRSEEAFYQGLKWCIEHREELPKMAQAAAERFAREGQTWDACAARHMKLYQQVLTGEQVQTLTEQPQQTRNAA